MLKLKSLNKLLSNINYKPNKKFFATTSNDSESVGNAPIQCCKVKDDPFELGQPTNWTHPHLFSSKTNLSFQVTPNITKDEYETRRNNYVDHLTSYQKFYFTSKLSSSEKAKLMSSQAHFLQNPDFDVASIDPNFIAIIPR